MKCYERNGFTGDGAAAHFTTEIVCKMQYFIYLHYRVCENARERQHKGTNVDVLRACTSVTFTQTLRPKTIPRSRSLYTNLFWEVAVRCVNDEENRQWLLCAYRIDNGYARRKCSKKKTTHLRRLKYRAGKVRLCDTLWKKTDIFLNKFKWYLFY